MPPVKNIVSFSSDGEYLAYSSPDGCLKIWETSTNILKQEYTPSSHLSATCSAISWCPNKHIAQSSKKPKKSKYDNDFKAISDLQLIAMGTLTGDILLYSYVNADLQSSLTNGHSSIVNDVCWCTSTCSLYSCSSDMNIVVWNVFTGKVKTKWKADNIAVYAICVIDNNNLLSASNSIKWWNVEQKTVIKTFIGHASEIFRLIPLKDGENSENSYFLSAAVGDRVINAWQLNTENSKRAVASFVVPDEPENISVSFAKDEPVLLSVVGKDGSLHIFKHVLNGYKKKPIHSKLSVQIASKRSESPNKPERIPMLCATISLGLANSLLSYGSFLKPSFETIDLSEVSEDLFLVRDLSLSSSALQDDVTRIKHTDKSEKVQLLAPGHLTPLKKVQDILRKRKKKEGDRKDEELPMEERLRALDLSKIPPNIEEQESTLKADSMVHLLLQGLQSKDTSMINTVLQNGDERIIQNTLKRLPLQTIILLLKELQERLSKKEQRNHPYLKWMKGLLSNHLPYLMSCKDVREYLGPINQLIEARIENFSKMCKLQGCLRILLSQTAMTNSENITPDNKVTRVYKSESEESDAEHDHDVNSSDEETAMSYSENISPAKPLGVDQLDSSEESDAEELDNGNSSDEELADDASSEESSMNESGSEDDMDS